jgi:hypothetical protein
MPIFLPIKYKFSHDFAFFLHDTLVETIVSGEKAGIFNVSLEWDSKLNPKNIESLSGEQLWSWLENNGYEWVTLLLSYKQATIALLSDFCHFVYEALHCSQKGKLTVAYSLLRKPFKENLFYLEWLLAEPADFIKKFCKDGPKSLDLSESITKDRKIEIIKAIIDSGSNPNWIPAEFLYDLRYKKGAPYGFESLWNQATHLITTFHAYTTDHQNFNFIFSDDDARLSQWEHFYSLVPLILYHAVNVIEALIKNIANRAHSDLDITDLRRNVGFILWVESIHYDEMGISLNQFKNIITENAIECPNCTKPIVFGKNNLKSLYSHGLVSCGSCNNKVNLLKPFLEAASERH